jgi:hypothetical protein
MQLRITVSRRDKRLVENELPARKWRAVGTQQI